MKNRMSCLFMATLLVLAACGKEQTDEQAISSTETVTTKSETARLETPAEVAAGAGFAVSWTGPDDEGDYVTIVEAGAQQGAYLSYAYTNSGTPLSLRALDSPGSYEIRYVDGASKDILVSAPITVTEVEARLDAPGEAGAGADFAVSWTGPASDGDYVTIVEAGAQQGSYLSYVYTTSGTPVTLTASETPGAYEVRYVMGQSKRILASTPISITAVEATLSVSDLIMVEAPIDVTWTGPANDGDYITLVEAGTPEGTYGDYTYARDGSPLTVRAPETPGLYELRYVMGQSKRILASTPVTVRPLSASLEAPSDTTAGVSFEVLWTGPNNPEDFIAIAKADAPADSYESRAYSRAGHPATLFTPGAPGTYEIRYVLAQSDSILAAIPISVTSPEQ